MSKFKKEITMSGAFDKRHNDPSKNYGIHCMDLRFVLIGKKGAVQFVVYTGIHLPHVMEELLSKPNGYLSIKPMGADLGYHSKKPMYEDQSKMNCNYTGLGFCYYDGSTLNADEFMPEFIAGGSDAVWKKLKEYYKEVFYDRP